MSTERVRQILSWYGSDNPGTKANLARMMNFGRLAGTGKMVILPVDQGFEHGPARSFAPNAAGFDPSYHVARYHFVHRVPHAWTPLHLARHRQNMWQKQAVLKTRAA